MILFIWTLVSLKVLHCSLVTRGQPPGATSWISPPGSHKVARTIIVSKHEIHGPQHPSWSRLLHLRARVSRRARSLLDDGPNTFYTS
jgi:hypothetical protein